ncbi:prepilin-type N-terminal cleavage/methylation domain-containing protein [Patescibacteria group bacterium]|nr:prepilin-type N-terminal cleavage/methylation domain-containing protein [Patescibacteria group bacterium]
MLKSKKGFTLIELLIVIGIIAILAGIVLVAVNPAQQFGKANDSERKSEIGTLLSAVYQYQTSPTARGALPECLLGATPTATAIPECDDDYVDVYPADVNGDFDGAVELGTPGDADTYDCSTTLVPSYLREIPIDPTSTYDATATGYYICQDTSGTVPRIYVLSPGAEVFTDDGGCNHPDGSGDPVMCVSG